MRFPRRHCWIPILLAVATCLATTACSGGGAPLDVLAYARGNDSIKLDPADVTDGESIKVCANLYEGLLEYTMDGTEVLPCLAESWTVSEDGKTYVFKLREGVTFHDGTPFDAAAVVTNFERQANPEHPLHNGLAYVYWEAMFAQVLDSVAATGGYEVTMSLKAPHAPFLSNLAMAAAYIVSPTALEKHGEEIARNPCGTGPFRFVHWLKDEEIRLERNDSYWRETARAAGLRFVPITDPSARLQRMQQGEFHLMDGLSTDHYDVVESNPKLVLKRQPGMNVAYLSLNHRRAPFDDVRVRRAVVHALDKQALADIVYSGHATPAKNPMPPTLWGYNDDIEDYESSTEKARALLEEAGAVGKTVELHAMQNSRPYMPDPMRVAQLIKSNLEAAGLQVKIRPNVWDVHLKTTQNAEHDMALLGWTGDNGDPDNFLYALLDKDNAKPGNAQNISFYESDELHDLLVRAQEAGDVETRADLYRQAQVVIHQDVGFVPLVHTEQTMVLAAGVEGFQLHPTGTVRLRLTKATR